MGTFVGADFAGGTNIQILTGLNWPVGVAADDIALLPWTMVNTAVPTDPTSESFFLLNDDSDGSCRQRLLGRYCDGSESGEITDLDAGLFNRQSAVLYVARGYQFISGFSVRLETVTGTSHDNPAISTGNSYGGNSPANGDTALIITSTRDGATTTAMPPTGYAKRTGSEIGVVGSGGTHTAVADDGLDDAVTLPHDPAAWTGFAATSGNAVTITLTLRPWPSGTTATLAGALSAASSSSSGRGLAASAVSSNLPAFSGSSAGRGLATATTAGALSSLVALATAAGLIGATLATGLPPLSAGSLGAARGISSIAMGAPSMAAIASGAARSAGQSQATMPAMVANISSSVPPASGTVSPVLPSVGLGTQAVARSSGDFSGSLPAASGSAAGAGSADSSLSLAPPAAGSSFSGGLVDRGDLHPVAGSMVAQTTGQSSTESALAHTLAPAAFSGTGSVEVPDTPVGAMDSTMPGVQSTSTGHSRAEGGLIGVLPAADLDALSGGRTSGSIGGTLPSPSASAEGSGGFGVEVALTLPTPSAAITATSEEQSGSGELRTALPKAESESVGLAVDRSTMTAALPPMSSEMSELRPALTLSIWVEDDLELGVEADSLRMVVEAVDVDGETDDQWYSYVEADWLEATT